MTEVMSWNYCPTGYIEDFLTIMGFWYSYSDGFITQLLFI